jgi:glucan 1,3-beta-glucosidase
MDHLRAYYTAGAAAVRSASGNTLLVAVHDAFYGPRYWSNYDPSSSSASASSPANYALLDTHQYYAFPPLGNLSQAGILGGVCNMSGILKAASSGLPQTVVGEWSLESGSGHDAAASTSPSSQEKRTWLRKMFEAQVAAYGPNGAGQPGVGWYYWTCEWRLVTK